MDNSIIYNLSDKTKTNISKLNIMEKINKGNYDKRIVTPHNKVYIIDNIVIKYKSTYFKEELEEFIDEATLYLLFNENNIGPEVHDTWYTFRKNKYHGYIILKKMDCDLMSLMKGTKTDNYILKENIYVSKEAIKELKYEIIKLHNLDYIHGDLMPKNILVELKDNIIIKMHITDFGLTDKRKYVINYDWIKTLYKYHKDHYPFMKFTINDIYLQPEFLDLQIFELFNIEPNSAKIV